MNKKGSAFLGVILAVAIFMFGSQFIPPVADTVLSTRVGLDCTNVAGITDGTKATCLVVDLGVPYFILTLISIAGGALLTR